jgi:hypothetical protein
MLTSWKANGNADIVTLANKLNYVRQAEVLTLLLKKCQRYGSQAEC